MNCPQCTNVALVMSERQGVEIDYCPQCRGVWLDRGELDKLIDKGEAELRSPDRDRDRSRDDDSWRSRELERDRYRDHGYPKKKRKGLLGEIFDFD